MKLLVFTVIYFIASGVAMIFLGYILPPLVSYLYVIVACSLLTSIATYYGFRPIRRAYFSERVIPLNKAVLITGCDSGFGYRLAKRLDKRGFHVFAGCLFVSGDGAKTLKESSSDRLRVVELNVTNDKSVEDAKKYIEDNLGSSELWAIVNNAGIYKGFDAILSRLQDYKDCLEVNTVGVIRLTRAFLPLLVSSKGRVVCVSSMAGRLSVPSCGAYGMSKCAVIYFSETLRQEVRPFGVKVVTIEPDGFKTAIVQNALADLDRLSLDDIDERIRSELKPNFLRLYKQCVKQVFPATPSSINVVVDSMDDAVSLMEPCTMYKPSAQLLARLAFFLMENCPKPLFDAIFRYVRYKSGIPS